MSPRYPSIHRHRSPAVAAAVASRDLTAQSASTAVNNAGDLSRLAKGLLGDRLLPAHRGQQMFSEGLSVWAYDFADPHLAAPVQAVEQQGAVGIYRSTLVLLPRQQNWLIVLANTDGEDY